MLCEYACVCAKLLHLCQTLCNPMDYSLPGSSVHRFLQARILEWVAIPFSRGSSQARGQACVSYIACMSTGFFTTSSTWEFPYKYIHSLILTVMLWTGNHYSHSRDEETKKRSSYRIPQGHTDIISPRARLALSSGLWTPCYPPPQNSETQM